jgi:hypothetical protein
MMHSAPSPDAFLDNFIVSDDTVKNRCLSPLDFGGELDNENNDVPLNDMYNTGLALTQQGRERQNLQIEGGSRCGLTGLIPSAEEGMMMMGAQPQPRSLILELEGPDPNQIEMSKKRRGLTR